MFFLSSILIIIIFTCLLYSNLPLSYIWILTRFQVLDLNLKGRFVTKINTLLFSTWKPIFKRSSYIGVVWKSQWKL